MKLWPMKKWMRIGRALLAIVLVLALELVTGWITLQFISLESKQFNLRYVLCCIWGLGMEIAITYPAARFYFNYVKDKPIREIYIKYAMIYQFALTIAMYCHDAVEIWTEYKSASGGLGYKTVMAVILYRQIKGLALIKVNDYERKTRLSEIAFPE